MLTPLTEAAIFLVLTVAPGGEETVRALLGDVAQTDQAVDMQGARAGARLSDQESNQAFPWGHAARSPRSSGCLRSRSRPNAGGEAMPSRILTLVRGLQWVVLTLQRTRSSITVGLARGLRRVILGWHLARARAEMRRLSLAVPAGIWFCDGCRQVLWESDSFSSHSRMHAR